MRPNRLPWLLATLGTACAAAAATDPFDPARLLPQQGNRSLPARASLALYPPEQWRFVGTIGHQGRLTGLVEDPERRVYLLVAGTRIDDAGFDILRVEADALWLRDTRPNRQGRTFNLKLATKP
jgi:Tfp pilus assembly protein PilP